MADSNDASPDFELLRYSVDGPVARILPNQPEKRDALSIALSDELIRAVALVQRSTDVKVLVIQGAGETFRAAKTSLWQSRRGLARDFWSDGPEVVAVAPAEQA